MQQRQYAYDDLKERHKTEQIQTTKSLLTLAGKTNNMGTYFG